MTKEKNRKRRNSIGAAVMAGLILVSLPLGVRHSLNGLREEARMQFYSDKAGYSIWDGLQARQEAANNLLTVAKKYTEAHPELNPYVNELEYRVQASENAYDETFYTEGEANMEMGGAAEALAGELGKITLDEKDQKYPAQLIAQMQSEQDKIERSSYNDAARSFADRLHTFPVNLLWRLTDVEPLVPFDAHGASADYAMEETALQEAEPEFFAQSGSAEDRIDRYADAAAEKIESYVEQTVDGIMDQVDGYVGETIDNALGAAERP